MSLRGEVRVMSRPKLKGNRVREVLPDSGFTPSGPVSTTEGTGSEATATPVSQTPWLTPKEAAQRARCGVKTVYREVTAARLRAARVGGRRELRIKPEWVDEWLIATTTPIEVAA